MHYNTLLLVVVAAFGTSTFAAPAAVPEPIQLLERNTIAPLTARDPQVSLIHL
jgi:hypothetical protein